MGVTTQSTLRHFHILSLVAILLSTVVSFTSRNDHVSSRHCCPAGMLFARCVVQRVDEDTGRVVVTLNRTTVPPSSALYLRSLLSETFASAAAADSNSVQGDAGAAEARPWSSLEFGATANAVVVALKEYGVVLKAVAPTGKRGHGDNGGQLMVCPLEHAMEGVEEGNEVKVSNFSLRLRVAFRGFLRAVCFAAGRACRTRSIGLIHSGLCNIFGRVVSDFTIGLTKKRK